MRISIRKLLLCSGISAAGALVVFLVTAREGPTGASGTPGAPITEWLVSSSPNWTIGEGSEAPIGSIAGAIVARDKIVIADPTFSRLAVFDSTGLLIRTIGRSGSGPGEFRAISGIAHAGDGIAVWDELARRITVFSDSGGILHTVSPEELPAGLETIELVGGLDMSTVALLARPFPDYPEVGVRRQPTAAILSLVDMASGKARESLNLRGPDEWLLSSGPAYLREQMPFTSPIMAAADDGVLAIYVGDSIRILEAGRQIVGRIPISKEPVGAKQSLEYLDSMVAASERRPTVSVLRSTGGMLDTKQLVVEAHERLSKALEFPDSASSATDIRLDSYGLLWLPTRSQRGSMVRWLILDLRLRPVAEVWLPAALRVLDITYDLIVAEGSGTLGEPLVELYRLERL